MRNVVPFSRPHRKASSTSSTSPQVKGITWIPRAVNVISIGREIAPQIRTCVPQSFRALARSIGCAPFIDTTSDRLSFPGRISLTKISFATSKTGETRSCHWAMATFMTQEMQRTCQESGTKEWSSNSMHKKELGQMRAGNIHPRDCTVQLPALRLSCKLHVQLPAADLLVRC
jgi:hypothetical protein